MKIAVAGTGYVGLSVALLLSQHNEVHALDIIPAKVALLNNGKSPIVDPVITDFLMGERIWRASARFPRHHRRAGSVHGCRFRCNRHADELRREEELFRYF